jgi:hypothetical protein
VVKDATLHQKVVNRISQFSRTLGLTILGVIESPLLGPKGNKEFFIHLRKGEIPLFSTSMKDILHEGSGFSNRTD